MNEGNQGSNYDNQKKDPIIMFAGTLRQTKTRKRDGAPYELVDLKLDADQRLALIEALTSVGAGHTGRVKLSVQIYKKINSQTGNTFDSAFAFVKKVEAPGENTTFAGANRVAVPTGAAQTSDNTQARTAAVFDTLNKKIV